MIIPSSPHDIDKELIDITKKMLADSGEPYKRDIRLDASLQRHLGLDSLARAELFQRIERAFSVPIPDRLFAEAETLEDVAVFLRESPLISKEPHKKTIIQHAQKFHIDLSKVQTLNEMLLLYGKKAADQPHIYFQKEDGNEEIITYKQLLNHSRRVAGALHERGLKEGETVAIMQPTNPGFFYTFFGTLLAGGIPVPIYPPFRMHMLEAYAKTESRILNSAGVRILVTFEEAETLSFLLQAFVPSLREVTTVGALLRSDETDRIAKPKADNFAFIQYTSGSTADPKGVLLTHQNLLANIRAYGKAIRVVPGDVAVSWLPLYHDMGLIGMWLGSLYHGVPLILMAPFTFLNHPDRWLWAIHYHRGTLSGAPNFAYELCIRKIEPSLIEGLDLSSWRVAANGAEKVYPHTLEAFNKKFAPYGLKSTALMPVYGLAESAVALAIPATEREFRIDYVDRHLFEKERIAVPVTTENSLSFVGCGTALENHEIRIVDDEDHVLPERSIGNLQFRGPSCMQGYYNNPRATQAVYHDGWWDSGDLAYLADGEVFITGRRKDLIIKAGRNLYPAEIEELVGAIPGVRMGCVAALGIVDERRASEQLVIVAETKEKNNIKRLQMIADIKETVATKLDIVPDQVVLVKPHVVPKTSSGKLQRAACKKMYVNGALNKFQMPAWMQIGKLGVLGFFSKVISAYTFSAKFIFTLYIALLALITFLPVYILVFFAGDKLSAKVVRGWCRMMLMMGFCRIEIIGKENLTKTSPVIYAANHASYIDAVVCLLVAPVGTCFVAKKELFSAPIFRTFMRKLNCLPVDRLDSPKGIEDTKRIQQALELGRSIMIFPEGTFGYSPGLRPFHLGAFKIAIETKTPVCPIALQGTRNLLRDDEKLFRPGKVTVTIGEPMLAAGEEWQDVIQLRNAVRGEIAKYCGEPSLDFIAAQKIAPKRMEN